MKSILVTGGSGLLGHALQSVYPDAIYCKRTDADLTSLEQTRKLFERTKPQVVVHLAALVGGVVFNRDHNATMLVENSCINTNVLKVAQEFSVKRVVSILSSCVFAESANDCHEEDVHVGQPFHGNLGYATSKRSLDTLTHLMHEQHRIEATTLLPVTLFGPYDHFDWERSHVISALIRKCAKAKVSGGSLEVWGTGNARRQFVFAGDVAQLIQKMLSAPYSGPQTTICAPKESISIRELATTIAKVMNFSGPIQFDSTKPEGQKNKVLRSLTFEKKFPNFTFTSFETALESTVRWFYDHYKNEF